MTRHRYKYSRGSWGRADLSLLKQIPPFDTYYVITGDDTAMEECLGRLVDAFPNQRILVWESKYTPAIPGIVTENDLIAAPYRGEKVSGPYAYSRLDFDNFYSVGFYNSTKEKEPEIDFLLINNGELVNPCEACVYAVDRLSGNCSPLSSLCISRGDKKWI